jgi:delta-aminolevulinic acid dehydratase/porphobilinogen synthase
MWSDRMQLEATNRTPAVSISSTGIEMKGECYPEDITAFAEPVMEALRQQLESAESFHARIELYYFNSSSAKFLFDFFEELEEAAEDGKQVQIDWCYRADDSSMQEAGEDFEEDFEHAQYQIVEI